VVVHAEALSASSSDVCRNVETAFEERHAEFRAGRRLAAAGLREVGADAFEVAVGARGMPIWPAGFTGSISHCAGMCVAAVAPIAAVASLGLDVESATVDEGLRNLVCRPEERKSSTPLNWIFSAKEAVFKCQYPITGLDAEFTDAAIEFARSGAFRVRIPDPRFQSVRACVGGVREAGSLIAAVAWLETTKVIHDSSTLLPCRCA
jgi:4'-phosphopantetheinyl transferase EntD